MDLHQEKLGQFVLQGHTLVCHNQGNFVGCAIAGFLFNASLLHCVHLEHGALLLEQHHVIRPVHSPALQAHGEIALDLVLRVRPSHMPALQVRGVMPLVQPHKVVPAHTPVLLVLGD